jgi:hypothetical protein
MAVINIQKKMTKEPNDQITYLPERTGNTRLNRVH